MDILKYLNNGINWPIRDKVKPDRGYGKFSILNKSLNEIIVYFFVKARKLDNFLRTLLWKRFSSFLTCTRGYTTWEDRHFLISFAKYRYNRSFAKYRYNRFFVKYRYNRSYCDKLTALRRNVCFYFLLRLIAKTDSKFMLVFPLLQAGHKKPCGFRNSQAEHQIQPKFINRCQNIELRVFLHTSVLRTLFSIPIITLSFF